LKGTYAKASVAWHFKAPEGAADTHYSIMRGTKCNLIIEQGAKEGYQPKLYIEGKEELAGNLESAVNSLNSKYPGIALERLGKEKWSIFVPEKYKVGHEAHFGQVTEKFLGFLKDGNLPDWEVPNMITKYYTTTSALDFALKNK